MTISTKKPLYAEVNNVPDDYEFTNEELNRIIAGDMFTPRQDAIMAREIQKLRAAMLNGDEPVSQTYKLPPLSSNEVNDAAWKLHNMLTEHGPLNGRQFNNLKGCFYEAFKVAMRNYPVTPDGWISCSEQMPDDGRIQFSVSLPAACGGDKYFIDGVFQSLRYERDCEKAVVAAGGVVNWVK
ncbi:hypothetical protein D2D35_04575 [Shigella sonnei]|uniref:hypothetical protein n=1 Tax=Escherichia fergusonii TaxID=564 RepID=UPI0019B49850|nr:hypothetical protein [Shigella sonnei]EFX6827857.1 hypothetical protein [Shigella sonnei]EFX7621059.1 hypothetical protein [Shigella sonnei]EFY0734382.1 hypothetical protein [Shigella sonnei]